MKDIPIVKAALSAAVATVKATVFIVEPTKEAPYPTKLAFAPLSLVK